MAEASTAARRQDGVRHDGARHDGARHDGDRAPGEENGKGEALSGVWTYVLGLGFALALTAASFGVLLTDLVWPPAIPAALLTLAVAQMGVHLVFFLHITTAPDNTNNILALAFGTLIMILVVGGSLWIMAHLNANMMPGMAPMDPEMQMPMRQP